MKNILSFNKFNRNKFYESADAQPAIKPAKPVTKPDRRERPGPPSPIRRDRPAIDPDPKAKEKDVIKRLESLGFNIKNDY